MKDFVRQLPGNVMLAALPEDRTQDKRMKRWSQQLHRLPHARATFFSIGSTRPAGKSSAMKNVNVYGSVWRAASPAQGMLDYIRRARGLSRPGARARRRLDEVQAMRPRPSGESARVMFKEYDVPLEPELGADQFCAERRQRLVAWHAVAIPGWGVHDAWLDLEGHLWFTWNVPNRSTTIGTHRYQNRRGQVFKVQPARPAAQHPWHDARPERHHLVQCQ